jgi:Uri superfamily endonuclease
MVLEPKPGTYALILSCSTDFGIQIGRLGTMRMQPGFYVYLGSGLGTGPACTDRGSQEFNIRVEIDPVIS